MFISPYFGGCKYTNNFLFINKNVVFQHFKLLTTSLSAHAGAALSVLEIISYGGHDAHLLYIRSIAVPVRNREGSLIRRLNLSKPAF